MVGAEGCIVHNKAFKGAIVIEPPQTVQGGSGGVQGYTGTGKDFGTLGEGFY